MNKKETIKNFVISIISNIVILFMGLVLPRVVLVHFGSDTNGLISTISQIFAYVALLEAGISQATINALYKPLRDGDREETINVLYASRKYYRNVTYVYALLVILLAFFLPVGIKSNLGYFTIFWSVFFEGASGVLSFYFVQTPSSLLSTDGKTYIKSLIELIIKMLVYGAKITLAMLELDIVFIQFAFFIISLIKVIIYKIVIEKKYKWLDYKRCTNKEMILPNRKAFVLSELAWTIFSSTDLIVLSFFTSTQIASVYTVNNLAFTAINSLLSAAYFAIYYLLGKAYYSGIENYKKLHDVFNGFFLGAITTCLCVALLLLEPFISLYTRGINDTTYNLYWLPIGFCLIQFLSWSRYVSGNLSGIAGYAKQVSIISMIEACVNLIGSILLVQIFGIYGVVFATIIALPLKVIYTNYIADKVIMKRSCKTTVIVILSNFMMLMFAIEIRKNINISIDNYIEFLYYGIVLFFIFGFVVTVVNILVNRSIRMLIVECLTKIRKKQKSK